MNSTNQRQLTDWARDSVTYSMFTLIWKRCWIYTNAAFLSSRRHNLPSKLKLHRLRTECLHVDATIMQSFRKSRFTFSTSTYAGHVGQIEAKHRWCMPKRHLSVKLKFSFLPNYRVKYYVIVKWCIGVAHNWCTSWEIALLFALNAA